MDKENEQAGLEHFYWLHGMRILKCFKVFARWAQAFLMKISSNSKNS